MARLRSPVARSERNTASSTSSARPANRPRVAIGEGLTAPTGIGDEPACRLVEQRSPWR